tara:strand:+ start:2081 stop:2272 length:192 start_codon:yes stop_codon:yes gene_type:complete
MRLDQHISEPGVHLNADKPAKSAVSGPASGHHTIRGQEIHYQTKFSILSGARKHVLKLGLKKD